MKLGRGLSCGLVLVLTFIVCTVAAKKCQVGDETKSELKDASGTLCLVTKNAAGDKLKYSELDKTYTACAAFTASNKALCRDDMVTYHCCPADDTTACNKPTTGTSLTYLTCVQRECLVTPMTGGGPAKVLGSPAFRSCVVTAEGTKLTFGGTGDACSSGASKFCTTGVENYKCCDDKSSCIDDKIKPTELDTCPRNCFVGKGKDAKEETTKTFKSCLVTSDGTTLMYSGLDGECSATAAFCKGEIKNYMCCNDKNYCLNGKTLEKADVKTPCPPPATNPPPPTTPDDSGSGSNLKCSVVLLVVVFARFLI